MMMKSEIVVARKGKKEGDLDENPSRSKEMRYR
jgi:hypothetical protein